MITVISTEVRFCEEHDDCDVIVQAGTNDETPGSWSTESHAPATTHVGERLNVDYPVATDVRSKRASKIQWAPMCADCAKIFGVTDDQRLALFAHAASCGLGKLQDLCARVGIRPS